MIELRRQIEKQSTDLGSAHRSLSDLRSKNAELEERLMQVNKELHGAQEFAKNLDIDLKVKKNRVFLRCIFTTFFFIKSFYLAKVNKVLVSQQVLVKILILREIRILKFFRSKKFVKLK